jgi:hypothetical protein
VLRKTHSRRRCRGPQARCFNPAGFSFGFGGCGEGGLAFRSMRLRRRRRPGKPGGPPLFKPSFKIQRDSAHDPKLPGSRSPRSQPLLTRAAR